MNNTCPQPGCNAAYDLSNQPLGTEFACTKCGQPLLVTAEGLELARSAATSGRAPPPQPGSPSLLKTYQAVAPQVIDRMRRTADLSTWLFAVGAVIALCALFFPLIDQAKVSRLEAMVVAGDMRQERLSAYAQRASATAEEKKLAEDSRAIWQTRKDNLVEYVENAELSRRSWTYWYLYLTLLGFGLLVVGSFGYLDAQQSLMRRVLGCIVLAATVLVVLNALARTSFRFEIGPGPF